MQGQILLQIFLKECQLDLDKGNETRKHAEAGVLARVFIDKRLCKGCGICVEFCPRKVLEMGSDMDERGFHMPEARRAEDCSLCGLCELYCPDFAICAREELKR